MVRGARDFATTGFVFTGPLYETTGGAYQQMGRSGAASGHVACSDGARGTFTAVEIDAGISGFTARAVVQFGACR